MVKRTNKNPLSTIQDCEILKAGLVDKISSLQHQLAIATEDNFSGNREEYAEWRKSVKISLYSMQRGIARINLAKKEIQLKEKANAETLGEESNRSKKAKIIAKAFSLIIGDVINDCVPRLNSTKAIASHYLVLADMPDGNTTPKQIDDECLIDDEDEWNR